MAKKRFQPISGTKGARYLDTRTGQDVPRRTKLNYEAKQKYGVENYSRLSTMRKTAQSDKYQKTDQYIVDLGKKPKQKTVEAFAPKGKTVAQLLFSIEGRDGKRHDMTTVTFKADSKTGYKNALKSIREKRKRYKSKVIDVKVKYITVKGKRDDEALPL